MAEQVRHRWLLHRFALVIAPAYACVLLSFVLPRIALDGWQAQIAVLIANTATWRQLPFFVVAMAILLISRPGIDGRRRALEGAGMFVISLLVLAGNAELNESVIKPAFAVPRPNLIALADHGVLGLGVEDFYALGDKQARREYLAPRLDGLIDPPLSRAVREHWLIETGYSFPSGHATASMTFASMMCAAGLHWAEGWRRVVATLVPVWAVAVVFTRPLLRVHTPTDVSVGAAVGIGLGVLGFAALHLLVDRFAGGADKPDPGMIETLPRTEDAG